MLVVFIKKSRLKNKIKNIVSRETLICLFLIGVVPRETIKIILQTFKSLKIYDKIHDFEDLKNFYK